MQLFVACDVCGHRYVLPARREGHEFTCVSCGIPFEVGSENEDDPDTSEFDDEEADDEGMSSLGPVWNMARTCGRIVVGLVMLWMLFSMSTLLFRSRRDEVARQMTIAGDVRPLDGNEAFGVRIPDLG